MESSPITPAEIVSRAPTSELLDAERGDGSLAKWLPVAAFADGRKWLALDRTGHWAWTAERDGVTRLYGFGESDVIGALPLLELEPDSLSSYLEPMSIVVGIPIQQLVKSLPYRSVVDCALKLRSDYWTEKALDWAEQLDLPEYASVFQEVITDSQIRQDLRHRAKRLVTNGEIA